MQEQGSTEGGGRSFPWYTNQEVIQTVVSIRTERVEAKSRNRDVKMTLAPNSFLWGTNESLWKQSETTFFFYELWKSTNFIATWRAFIQVNLSQNSSSMAPTFPANSLTAEPWSTLTTNNSQESWGKSTGSPHPGDGAGRAKGLLEFLSPNPGELSLSWFLGIFPPERAGIWHDPELPQKKNTFSS